MCRPAEGCECRERLGSASWRRGDTAAGRSCAAGQVHVAALIVTVRQFPRKSAGRMAGCRAVASGVHAGPRSCGRRATKLPNRNNWRGGRTGPSTLDVQAVRLRAWPVAGATIRHRRTSRSEAQRSEAQRVTSWPVRRADPSVAFTRRTSGFAIPGWGKGRLRCLRWYSRPGRVTRDGSLGRKNKPGLQLRRSQRRTTRAGRLPLCGGCCRSTMIGDVRVTVTSIPWFAQSAKLACTTNNGGSEEPGKK